MSKRQRIEIADATVEGFARELEEYRLGGCPSGGAEALRSRIRKSASKHGVTFAELWGRVHARAYALIDAGDGKLRSGQVE